MTKLRHIFASTALTTSLLTVTFPAYAALDEIVVTAQKRASTLQDTSIALTVFDSDALVQSGVLTAQDLAQYTPNVVMTNNSNISSPEIFIRGIGTAGGTSDISVGFYIDEVYIGSSDALVDLHDMERVEILRGPQGTLYGRNTIGGAVNYITKLPGEEFDASLRVNYGNYDFWGVNGSVSGPIGERVRAGLSLNYKDGGGYIKNLGPGPDRDLMDKGEFSGRATVVFDVTDNAELILRADASTIDVSPIAYRAIPAVDNDPDVAADALNAIATLSTPFSRVPADGNPASLLDPSVPNLVPLLNGDLGPFDLGDSFGFLGLSYAPPSDPYDVLHDQDQKQKRDSKGISATLNLGWDAIDVTSITSYRERETRLVEDTDGTPFAWASNNTESDHWQVSQELRFSNANPDRFEWVAGLYYFHEESEGSGGIISDEVDTLIQSPIVQLLLPLPPIGVLGGRYFTDDMSERETTSYAAYAHGKFQLNDQWSLEGGLRYSRDEKKLDFTQFCGDFVLGPVVPLPFLGGGSLLCNGGPLLDATGAPDFDAIAAFHDTGIFRATNFEEDWDAWTPEFGVNFEPNDDVLLYAKVSRGFKSGGFDTNVGAFDPEFVWAYQAGAKTSWFDNRVNINAEAFYYDHTDLQVRTVRTVGALRAAEITTNGGDSEDYGFEIEMIAQPIDNFTLQGSVGYVHAEYGEFIAKDPLRRPVGTTDPLDPTVVNLEGNSLINAPEWSTSLIVQYDIPTDVGTFSARAEHQYKSEYFFTEFNEDVMSQDAYNLFNARLSYTTPDERFQLALWGRNLGDELYYAQKLDLREGAIGAVLETPAAPRTYGVELIFNY